MLLLLDLLLYPLSLTLLLLVALGRVLGGVWSLLGELRVEGDEGAGQLALAVSDHSVQLGLVTLMIIHEPFYELFVAGLTPDHLIELVVVHEV